MQIESWEKIGQGRNNNRISLKKTHIHLKENNWKRQRVLFHQLFDISNGHNIYDCPGLKLWARNSIRSPMWMAFSGTLSRTLDRKWSRQEGLTYCSITLAPLPTPTFSFLFSNKMCWQKKPSKSQEGPTRTYRGKENLTLEHSSHTAGSRENQRNREQTHSTQRNNTTGIFI